MTENCDRMFWCVQQDADDEGIYCTADIAEGRVFNCPYASALERAEAEYPCSNYQPV